MMTDPTPKPPAREESLREDRLAIRAMYLLNFCMARMFHRTIVCSPCQLPKQGPAILVCNHTSGLDPFFIQTTTRRIIIWLLAKEFYEIRVLKRAFKLIHVIPVERSGRDLAATRAALRALADGSVLGIFPEGKIETTGKLLPFQVGAAMMAIKTGVPVYPAYVDGTQRGKKLFMAFLERQRATLRFGPPVEFDRSSGSRPVLEAATAQIEAAVAALSRTAPITVRPAKKEFIIHDSINLQASSQVQSLQVPSSSQALTNPPESAL
jgi:1-acyl-sn-glycerol-3-phosphate acyltransferase